jgi:hypothetical protein
MNPPAMKREIFSKGPLDGLALLREAGDLAIL